MNESNNYALKFNEERYATKDDVKKHFNMSSVDSIWKTVVDYRKSHTKTLELPCIDRTKFSLVLTRSITNRILFLERNFSKAFMKYIRLTPNAQRYFKHIRYQKIISSITNNLGINNVESFVDKIIDNNISTVPTELLAVDNYIRALDYIENYDGGNVSYQDFNCLNGILNGKSDYLETREEKCYRTEEEEQPHYYQSGYVYKCALIERIDEMMEDLVAFMNDDNEYGIVRSIATLFYYQYIKPFDYFNEENTCLACKLISSKVGFSSFACFLNVENLLLNKDPHFDFVKANVQKTLDITYYFDYVLNFFKDDLEDLEDDLLKAEKEAVINENKLNDLSKEELDKVNENSEEQQEVAPQVENNGFVYREAPREQVNLYGAPSVALPIFPQGLSDDDVDRIVVDLMETYPALRHTQAEFYARHCTIGKFYTIQQFKEEEQTSYETARTSMDFLVELGFYSKSKLRNKFVYKPIPRR